MRLNSRRGGLQRSSLGARLFSRLPLRQRGHWRASDAPCAVLEKLEPRMLLSADSVVVFNEVMYNPFGAGESTEFIELHNQMGVDIDISNWSINDGVSYRFPAGTIISAGGYVVVASNPGALQAVSGVQAFGPFAGQLSNSGERIQLLDNSGRLMDEMNYDDEGDWPVAADGSGASLAKKNPDTASGPARNWTHSEQIGGTPGRRNFIDESPDTLSLSLVELLGPWKYEASGAAQPANWFAPGFDDSGWSSGDAVFYAGTGQPTQGLPEVVNGVTATATSELVGTFDRRAVHVVNGNGLVGDAHGIVPDGAMWLNNGTFAAPNDLAPEITFDLGGVYEIAEMRVWNYNEDLPGRPELLGRGISSATILVAGEDQVFSPLIVNQAFAKAPGTQTDFSQTINLGGVEARYVKLDIHGNHGGDNNFVGLSEVRFSGFFDPRRTELPLGATTYYYRTTFDFNHDAQGAQLFLDSLVDDGAIYYLNGVEIHRQNMPGGAVSNTTQASSVVGDASLLQGIMIDPSLLVDGENVLAVEVHQAVGGGMDPDMLFGAAMRAIVIAPPPDETRNLVVLGDVWSYEASNTPQPADWKDVAFDDSAWASDTAPLAAGPIGGGTQMTEIQPATVSAFSSQFPSRLAVNTVNGSGLINGMFHSTDVTTMWLTNGTIAAPNDTNPEITFDLGSVISIDRMRVWNYNEYRPDLPTRINELLGRGVATADILIAGSNQVFTPLITNQAFTRAPTVGATADFSQYIDFGGVMARYVKIDIRSNHNGKDFNNPLSNDGFGNLAGLSEVQFIERLPIEIGDLPTGASTYYFRHEFPFGDDPDRTVLNLDFATDDGAVFYLNGVEVYRHNMPGGTVTHTTTALNEVTGVAPLVTSVMIDPSSLIRGQNVLAVEVHPFAAVGDPDMYFDAALTATVTPPPPFSLDLDLAINEVAGASDAEFFIELHNHGDTPISLTGFILRSSTDAEFTFGNTMLPAGGFVAVTAAQLGFTPLDGDKLFLLTSDDFGVVDGVEVKNLSRARSPDGTGEFLRPDVATPGAANSFNIPSDIVINEIMYHFRPEAGTADTPATYDVMSIIPINAGWRYNATGADLGTTWHQSAHPIGGGWLPGQGLIGYETSALPEPLLTTLTNPLTNNPYIVTYYFELEFNVTAQQIADMDALHLRHIIDDGAIFFLNGSEIHRYNMPGGVVTAATLAPTAVDNAAYSSVIAIDKTRLVVGTNRLSVEVHQSSIGSSDIVFGAELSAVVELTPFIPGEPFGEPDEEWVELYNRGAQTVDLTGWELSGGIDFDFPAGTMLGPGQYLVVARNAAELSAKYPGITILGNFSGRLSNTRDVIKLLDPNNNPADVVEYVEGGRWDGGADGNGSSLELRDPLADNASPEAWAASDELPKSQWQTYSYRGIASPSSSGADTQWRELVIGLLDSGEILLDDIRVIRDPNGAAINLIQNSTFQGDTVGAAPATWRLIGTHGLSKVVLDPDNAANKVLHLIADGATEHKHNHGETTFAGGASIINGVEYEITFRARWITGSNQFNTRLYFNRLAQTTLLSQPANHGTPGAPNSRLESNIGPTYDHFIHSPAVPAPNQPVTVTAVAQDPQGVTSMTLFYSVNGGAWNSLAMTDQGGGTYTGTVPGQIGGTIVQFYVEGEDGLGATSTFPRGGADSRALYKVDDGLAATNGLQNLRMILTPADAAFLHETTNLMSNRALGATLIYNEREIFYDAGVRLSGSQRARPYQPRLSFSVRFPADQLFRGIHSSVTLDRSESTGFGQQEILTHTAMAATGGFGGEWNQLIHIITPQLAHTGSAEMQLARFSDTYLDSFFDNGADGDLFEYELIYYPQTAVGGNPENLKLPQPDGTSALSISDHGDDKEDYRWNFEIKNQRARDNYSDLIAWAKVMGLSGSAFNDQIGNYIDVDQWLRSFAIQVISGAGDSFGGDGSTHNVQFYVRPQDGKVLMFPHDLDAFLSATRPLVSNPTHSKLMAVPANAHHYYGHVHDIITETYNTAYMQYWTTHYGALLPAQNFAGHLSFITTRSNFLLNAINSTVAQVPFNITTGDFTVNDTVASIDGTGWVNVRELRVAGSDVPLNVNWQTVTGWQVTLPVAFGQNAVTIEAYDFRGRLIGSDTINIESTVSGRPVQDYLRVTEVHYHPAEPTPAEAAAAGTSDRDQFEFIELKNISDSVTLDLTGVRFTNGITFDFTGSAVTSLMPGQYVVLVANTTAFNTRYGTAPIMIPVAGQYTGQLSNAGETLTLVDDDDAVVQNFTYDDDETAGWLPVTDGGGRSLDIADPTADVATWSDAASWRASGMTHGTPGRADPRDGTIPGDANYNYVVNITDLSIVAVYFGLLNSHWDTGDFNGDGRTNISDLSILATRFGAMATPGGGDGSPAGAAAGEESSVDLLAETTPPAKPAKAKKQVVTAPLWSQPAGSSSNTSTWGHIQSIL